MRLYDNALSNSYEELKTFYPVWYRDVLEMDALWRVFGNRLDDIQAGLVQAISNCYINTADEAAIRQFEEFLYITYDGPRTLDERRALVSSFFIGNGHIGEREIKEIIEAFTVGDISVSLSAGGVIEISVTRGISDQFNLPDCVFILNKRIPAHLGIVFHDVFLPIKFTIKERFILENISFGSRFYNGGSHELSYLDGRKLLDGTWQLNQKFKGILFPQILFKTFFISTEAVSVGSLAFSAIGATNHACKKFEAFRVSTATINSSQLVDVDTAFSISTKQKFSMSASLIMDSMYKLDGAVLLDGATKLNASIIKEEI